MFNIARCGTKTRAESNGWMNEIWWIFFEVVLLPVSPKQKNSEKKKPKIIKKKFYV